MAIRSIYEAGEGQEALEVLKEQKIDLVLTDINMPKMDGKETISKIKENEHLANIPVVVFTTSSNTAHQKYFESQGVHFITKPFDYKVFTKEIIRLLAYCADLGA